MHQPQAFFVTRAKSNTQFRRVYSAPADRSMGLICDQTLALTGMASRKDYPVHLHRIRSHFMPQHFYEFAPLAIGPKGGRAIRISDGFGQTQSLLNQNLLSRARQMRGLEATRCIWICRRFPQAADKPLIASILARAIIAP
jgi:hypothetical protein